VLAAGFINLQGCRQRA